MTKRRWQLFPSRATQVFRLSRRSKELTFGVAQVFNALEPPFKYLFSVVAECSTTHFASSSGDISHRVTSIPDIFRGSAFWRAYATAFGKHFDDTLNLFPSKLSHRPNVNDFHKLCTRQCVMRVIRTGHIRLISWMSQLGTFTKDFHD